MRFDSGRGVERREFVKAAVAIGGTSAFAACMDRERDDGSTASTSGGDQSESVDFPQDDFRSCRTASTAGATISFATRTGAPCSPNTSCSSASPARARPTRRRRSANRLRRRSRRVRRGGWEWAASRTDFDNDGDRDVVAATYGGPVAVYENIVADGNSVALEVVDDEGATALGAVVTVAANGDETVVL